ncbi:serine/threonine-protein kinase [Fischerella thermalis]|uniref:serine/threonine-protein kinase n=2 Tax=Fischerella thermalis TaxID=372787 RepID=UPI000C809C60|nr:serine/threonine-protein kinase [Fischerella thermalis]PLZ32526.1 serine/threonine protein kinase [Fischerella thermalis WC558]PLZ54231.1 serine/threonine protein kinase [Fischerella thermalis WC439]PLZ55175.1 serine/threonine protein kinase [Fischerella thermalis WC442]PLZ82023.1 serine/threonine protein kinase [Fischerella thermalis WC213]
MNVYCSKGHENPPDCRFCLHCGEKLDAANQGIQPGQTLGDRYLVVRQIGQGGFGRTYLAEDINRFRELCVLKEFSPQVQTAYVLKKAEELFQREATVLYKLQHPQIPRFRELFRSNFDGKEYLFLVQDYVEGQTYRSLLNERLQKGLRFTESEVIQLLLQILPVLEYIHSLGVIHRDISPDNLMLRKPPQTPPYQGGAKGGYPYQGGTQGRYPYQGGTEEGLNHYSEGTEEGLPVLIDFGGVKQVAAVVVSQYYQPNAAAVTPAATLLGKFGYAPPEQMQTGLVEPHSDLYALAATALVLLTGKQPSELIDDYTLAWKWRREINLSPTLGAVLDKMLSPVPQQRYQSARQVLQALNPSPATYPPTQPPAPVPNPPTTATLAVAPSSPSPHPPTPSPTWWTPEKIIVVFLLLTTSAVVAVWGGNTLLSLRFDDGSDGSTPQPTPTFSPTQQPLDPLAKYSPAERARKERLRDRRQRLGIDENFYVSLVNQVFWENNPSLQRRSLTDEPEDTRLRAQWDKTAEQLLQKLTLLSSESRKKLGTYGRGDRDRWKVEVNKLNVSSRALYDLADAAFFQQFPEQESKNFIDQPIGQVWHAFVADKLSTILARSAFGKINFDPNTTTKTVSGNLRSSAGKVFIADLRQNQLMKVNLAANPQVLWSIYSPTGKYLFLEDSQKRSWSGELPESGFYEFVVVSRSSQPLSYQLTLNVENPTPTPSPTPTDTPTSEPTPTPTSSDTATPTP